MEAIFLVLSSDIVYKLPHENSGLNNLMTKTIRIKVLKITFILLLIGVSFKSFSQVNTGELQGKVIDKKTKSVVEFAKVILYKNETYIAAGMSDTNGDFTIKNLDSGIYNVEVSYVGYKKFIMIDLEIESGVTKTIALELSQFFWKKISLDTIVPLLVNP